MVRSSKVELNVLGIWRRDSSEIELELSECIK